MKKKVAAGLGAGVAAAALLALALAACPNPINSSALDEMTDEAEPVVKISSPAEGSAYTQTVTVQGTATDNGKVRTLSYQVSGTLGLLVSGQIDGGALGAGGAFSFQFSTIAFNGPIVVVVAAQDWNDNAASASVTLQYPGSAVASFTAVPASKQVQLSWEAVPGATGYTIYYTTNGTFPSESYGTQIPLGPSVTSHNLTGLANGALHVFVLKAGLTGGGTYYSSYVSVIPLSQLSLAPVVTGGYREIRLEWAEIAATSRFEVLRSTSADGPFENYTGTVQGNSFTDTGVVDNQWYYYKVRPAQSGSIESHANAAQTLQVPTTQSRVSSLTTPYDSDKVRIAGSYAYVAAGTDGLMVINVADPRAPQYVTRLATTDARDLAINGSTLYLADGSAGLRIISLANPAAPTVVGTCNSYSTYTIGTATQVSIVASQNRAFVLDSSGDTAVFAINIASPTAPTGVSRYSSTSYTMVDLEAVYYNNYCLVYIATMPGNGECLLELYLYMVGSNQLSYYRTYTNPDYTPTRLAVSGNYIYCLANKSQIVSGGDPPYELMILANAVSFTAPSLVGEYATSLNGYPADIRVSGGRAYAVDAIGMHVFDVFTPSAPQQVDQLNTPGKPTGIDVSGGYAFVASAMKLFQAVDLSLPNGPVVVGTYDSGGSYGMYGAVARGPYLYAATTGAAQLQILDVSNPTAPAAVTGGTVAIAGATAVALSGPYAFVAAWSDGLRVVDVETASAPALVGSAPAISGSLRRIVVKGDYAYVAGSTGLQIYDVSDPTQPVGVGFFDADGGGGIQDVAIRGRHVYASEGAYFQPNNLKIIDVGNPAAPVLAGKASLGMQLHHVSLCGDYAFVSDDFPGSGLWAVNINPSSGAYLSTHGPCDTALGATTGSTKGVVAFAQYAYVSDPASGFGLVDISDPTALDESMLITTVDWSGSNPEDVILSGKYAYVPDSTEGLKVIRLFP